jgi:hypothetical protein
MLLTVMARCRLCLGCLTTGGRPISRPQPLSTSYSIDAISETYAIYVLELPPPCVPSNVHYSHDRNLRRIGAAGQQYDLRHALLEGPIRGETPPAARGSVDRRRSRSAALPCCKEDLALVERGTKRGAQPVAPLGHVVLRVHQHVNRHPKRCESSHETDHFLVMVGDLALNHYQIDVTLWTTVATSLRSRYFPLR